MNLLKIALALSLATNAWFASSLIHRGLELSHAESQHKNLEIEIASAVALLQAVADGKRTKAELWEAAKTKSGYNFAIERDGYMWVPPVGLAFDSSAQLIRVVPTKAARAQ